MTQEQNAVISDPSKYANKSLHWYEYFDEKRRREILRILDEHPGIITEHESNPTGYRKHPSPYLQRIHNYFRMQPTFGKYYIYTESAWKAYKIAEIQEFGELPQLLDGEYRTEEEAMHAVFLRRIEDIRDQ